MTMPVKSATSFKQLPAAVSNQTNKQPENIPSNPEKKQISTKAKVIGGLSALAILGTAVYFGMKGRNSRILAKQEAKLQELVSSGVLDEDYLKIFKDIRKLDGEEFIKTAYDKLAQKIGLTKVPELKIENNLGSCLSGFDSITLRTGGLKNKAEQLEYIRHELEHAKQTEMMFRAFGKDAVLDSYAERIITHLKMNPLFCSSNFKGKYNFKDVTPEELKVFIDAQKAKLAENTGMLDEILKTKGKIKSGTPEFAEAEKYFEASKNYKSPGMLNGVKVPDTYFEQIMKEYKNNLLEFNAFKEGKTINDMYTKFMEIVTK